MNIKILLYSIISLLVCAGISAAELTEAERRAAVAEAQRTVYGDVIQQVKFKKEKVKAATQQPVPDAQQSAAQALEKVTKHAQLLKHKLLLKDPLNKDIEIDLDPVLLQTSKTLQDVLENVDTEAIIPIANANEQTIDLLVQALKDHTTLRGVPYNELIEIIELYDFLHIQSTELSLEYLFETIKDNYNLDNLTPDLQELFLRYYFRKYIIKNTLKFNLPIFSVALSADGSIVMAGSYDTTAQIIDVKTGDTLHTLQFNYRVTSVALSADGSIAIAGSLDKTAQIIDVKTGNTLHTLQFNNTVSSVALSADSSIAMAGSSDKTAQIVDVKTGNTLHTLKFAQEVYSVALSANGSIAMGGSLDGTAQIIDVKTGNMLHTLQFNDAVNAVALSADGSIAIAEIWNKTAQIVNVKTGEILHILQFNDAVNAVALSANGSIAIAGSADDTAQIVDVKTSKMLHRLQFNNAVTSVALSADGSIAMVGSRDKTAQIIDVKTGNMLHTLQFNNVVYSVALSANGSIAIAGSEDRTAQIQLVLSTQPIEVLIEQYKTKDEPLPSLTTELSEGII